MQLSKEMNEWLNSEPPAQHIIVTKEGIKYIPFSIIESYINHLTNGMWDTKSFQRQYVVLNHNEGIDVSIEVALTLTKDNGEEYKINRVGSCTYTLSFIRELDKRDDQEFFFTNEHYSATAKTFAIINAVRGLGRRFGKFLNESESIIENEMLFDKIDLQQEEKKIDSLKHLLSISNSQDHAMKLLSNTSYSDDKNLIQFIEQKFKK